MSQRLNDIRNIVRETIQAKRHKKGGITNGNSRNGIEVVLSNKLKKKQENHPHDSADNRP